MDGYGRRFPAQEPTSLYAQFHKDVPICGEDIYSRKNIMLIRSRIRSELETKTSRRDDSDDRNGSKSMAERKRTQTSKRSGSIALQGKGGQSRNITNIKSPTKQDKNMDIYTQNQDLFLREQARWRQEYDMMPLTQSEDPEISMSHQSPVDHFNSPSLENSQDCGTEQDRVGVRSEVCEGIDFLPTEKMVVNEVEIPQVAAPVVRNLYPSNQVHGYTDYDNPRQKQSYHSVLQTPYREESEYTRNRYSNYQKNVSKQSQHLQAARSDFLTDSPLNAKYGGDEFESRYKNRDFKPRGAPSHSNADLFVVDIDYEDSSAKIGRPNPEELRQRLTSARPIPPSRPQRDMYDEMVRPMTPRNRTASLGSALHSCGANTGAYGAMSMENLIHRRMSSSTSINQLPQQFFADSKSYTSLIETDIDTGEFTERPLVVETDIDKAYNDLPFRTRSMVNLTGSYTLPKYNPFPDDLTKTKSEMILESPQRQPPKPEMPERKLSEHELKVTQSLGKLNVPKWYTESPLSKQTSGHYSQNRYQGSSPQNQSGYRDGSFDTRYKTSTSGYQMPAGIVRSRVYTRGTQPKSHQPQPRCSKQIFQLPSARLRQTTPKELSPIPIKTKEEIKATLRARTTSISDPKLGLPMKGPVGVGTIDSQHQHEKLKSSLEDYRRSNGMIHVERDLYGDHGAGSAWTKASESPPVGRIPGDSSREYVTSSPEEKQAANSEQEMLFSFLRSKHHVISPADSRRSLTSVCSATGAARAGKDGAFPVLSLGPEMECGSMGDLRIELTDTVMLDTNDKESQSQIEATVEEVIDDLLALHGSPPSSTSDLTVSPGKISEESSPLADSPLTTSKGNLEGTYIVSGEDVNYPTPDATHIPNQEVIRVKCRNSKCGKTSTLKKAKKSYKTCHNCYTYYCGRECRKAHWEKHKKKCVYSRINSACKHVIKKVHDDPDLQYQLSRIARTGYLSQGRGCVMLPFHSPDDAERFLTEGLSALAMPPTYVASKEMGTAGVAGDHLLLLNEMSKNYNPEMKLVLNVAIVTGKEVPAKPHPRHPVIKKCAKLRLSAAHVNPKASDEDEPETLILTAVPGSAETENMEARKAREICFINMQRKLRQKGISLRHQYPDVYGKLCAYVSDNASFTPIAIYPLNVNSGKKFMCMIMPNSEPEVEWTNKSDILDELDLTMDVSQL